MELKRFDDKVFEISIYYEGRKVIKLFCCYCSEMFERFTVYGNKQTITIQNNRPEMRRLNKQVHKFKWKMTEGPATIPRSFLKALFDAMNSYIENVIEGGNAATLAHKTSKK